MHKTLMAERRDKKITQEEVASAIGMNKATYGRKERGESYFDLQEASEIAKYMGMPIDKLFPEFF